VIYSVAMRQSPRVLCISNVSHVTCVLLA